MNACQYPMKSDTDGRCRGRDIPSHIDTLSSFPAIPLMFSVAASCLDSSALVRAYSICELQKIKASV